MKQYLSPWPFATLLLLTLDLGTKWLAKSTFPFLVSQNPGIAFSIPIPNLFMVVATPVILIFIGWWFSRHAQKNNWARLCFSLFVAGGLGNFLNRLWDGSVTDFINSSFWPSFNLADAYLTTASFLLIIFYGRIIKNN